ncbi:MAG: helix-turn-helix domain-containing protein [Acidobacteria bacterium]|nr:helix-turn-helix domain-containing protein [Acidobacteriota bacterium]
MGSYTKEELLPFYLEKTAEQRNKLFADTARTAEIFGVSQRTIQNWIELGWIQAIKIGKKHQVYLNSVTEYIKREN